MNGQLASLIQRRAGGGHRDVSTQRTRSRGGARRPATTPPPVGAGRRAAGTSIERHHGNTSGFCAFCRLCFRAAARSMPRAARPPAGDVCHFSPRDSAPQRPLRDIVSALSASFASDDKVIYVSLLKTRPTYVHRFPFCLCLALIALDIAFNRRFSSICPRASCCRARSASSSCSFR